ncbi:MAG: hypothetical protein ABW133_21370, partial [Polyangiaceae bacterium]
MIASKRVGLVALVGLLSAASVAQAEPRKKGSRSKAKGGASSMQRVDSPGSSSSESINYASPFDPPPAPPPSSTPSTPPPAPESAAPPERDAPQESETGPVAPRPDFLPIVVAGLEPLWEGRVMRQNDATGRTFRKNGAIGFGSFEIGGEVYPLSNGPSKFLRGFGLTFQYSRSLGFQSDSAFVGDLTPAQDPVDTTFSRYSAGLRYRLPVNAEGKTPIVLGASASYSGWSYRYAQLPEQQNIEVPTSSYQMARIGIDGSVIVRPVTFYANVYYLHALSVVPSTNREMAAVRAPPLPNGVGTGAELRGAVGVRVLKWLEVRASVQYGLMM